MNDAQISAVLAKEFPAPKAAPPPPPKPSTYADVIKSAASGLGQGAAAVAGLPGDIGKGVQWIGDKIVGQFDPASVAKMQAQRQAQPDPLGLPTSAGINRTIQSVTGPYHEPQTTPGEYARTIAAFAPAAIAPGGVIVRAARVVVPGAASEAAGQVGDTISPELGTAGRVVGALGGGAAATAGLRSINALAVGKGLSPILDPNVIAAEKIRAAVAADGGPAAVGRNAVDWANSGASSPALIDVAGNATRRLVRAASAGGSGDAQNIATTYADRIRANFQPTVLSHTRDLTPDVPDSAVSLGKQLEADQGSVADTQYKEPYQQPAVVTKDMVSALQGPEGRAAINRAFVAARANRDTDLMAQLQDLKDAAAVQGGGQDPITGKFRDLPTALANLSSRALDRVRIAMRDTGLALAKNDNRDIAGGYFGRVKDIDSALDQTPGLQGARQVYKQMQAESDALPVGQSALNTGATDYAAQISDLAAKGGPPNLGRSLQVGHRQALVDKLSAQTGGATGAAKNIASSDQDTQNLAMSFGADKGSRYQAQLGNEVRRVGNADYISPNTGSQTQLRASDSDGLMSRGIPHSLADLAIRVYDTIKGHGAPLTEGERAAIVRMGTTEADLRNLIRRNPNLNRAAVAQIAANSNGQGQ
jgi:hypothetical protein